MKALAQYVLSPQKTIGLLFFSSLAFLPSILHLASQNVPLTNPVVALGPIAAGFLFASSVREIRVNFLLLGTLLATLLYSVNWLMFAGACCSTLNN